MDWNYFNQNYISAFNEGGCRSSGLSLAAKTESETSERLNIQQTKAQQLLRWATVWPQ